MARWTSNFTPPTREYGVGTFSDANIYGKLSLGSSSAIGQSKLDILGDDNTTIVTIKNNANQANTTATDTFIDFRSTTGSEATIAGTAVAGVIAYSTFTGSHYTQVVGDRTNLKPNMLLEIVSDKITNWDYQKSYTEKSLVKDINGETKTIKDLNGMDIAVTIDTIKTETVKSNASTKGQLFKTQICNTRQSKNAIGVYGGTNNEGQDLCLSMGTGFLIVANKGKDIAIGDYLMSSDITGCVELQDDDLIHNYTIGKATENIVWNKDETTRTISVIYEGG